MKYKNYLIILLAILSLSFAFISCPDIGLDSYSVNITIEPEGAGTVEINPDEESYEQDSIVTLTVNENNGYTFSGWMGDIQSLETTYELKVDMDYTITAKFIKNSWTQATNEAGWTERHSHASVVFDETDDGIDNPKMWVLGGYVTMSDVWNSTDGETWTEVASSTGWGGRYGHTALVFDETDDDVDNPKMWVLGGYEFSADNDVWCSSDGVNWTEVTPDAEWSERAGHASVVFDGKMWVLGGQENSSYYISDAWSSADGLNWTLENSEPGWYPRLDHTALVFNDKLWLISGDHYGNNEIWSSEDGQTWSAIISDLDDDDGEWYNRSGHTSVVFDDKMWIIGGYGMGEYEEVWASIDGVNWSRLMDSAEWNARSNHTSLVFDDKIWIIGGSGSDGGMLSDYSDVWYLE